MAPFCGRCGEPAEGGHECDREGRPGSALDPPRYCGACGARLKVQVLPAGYSARCLPCERRARFGQPRAPAERARPA